MIGRPPAIKRLATRLSRDTRGGSAIEYGMILAVITLAMVASFTAIANTTVGMWGNVSTKVTTATARN